MIPTRRPPSGPPASVGVLAKYAQAYARAGNISEGRVRTWISYMITAGVLERATANGHPHFIIKGGVALELRYIIAAAPAVKGSVSADLYPTRDSRSWVRWLRDYSGSV